MAFTYTGDPASSPRDLVRFLIGDVNPSVALFQDAEVDAIVGTYSSPRWAAVALIDAAIARYAFVPDRVIDGLSIRWSTVVANLKSLRAALAQAAEDSSMTSSGGAFYAGGMSYGEKRADDNNQDLVKPSIRRGYGLGPWYGISPWYSNQQGNPL